MPIREDLKETLAGSCNLYTSELLKALINTFEDWYASPADQAYLLQLAARQHTGLQSTLNLSKVDDNVFFFIGGPLYYSGSTRTIRGARKG